MLSHSGRSGNRAITMIVGAMAMMAVLLLAGLAQAAAAKPQVIDTGEYIITYKAAGVPVTLNPSGVVSFNGVEFNPSSSAAGITVNTTGTLTITVNGKSADQLSIKKKKGVTTATPVASLQSNGGFAKLYTDADISQMLVLGNVNSLTSKNASVDDAVANGFGTVTMTSLDAATTLLDTWTGSTIDSVKPLAGKTTLNGIALASGRLDRQNGALTVATKTAKTGTVHASVLAGTVIAGRSLSVAVRGGDLLANTVQAQQGIKALSASRGKDGFGGTLGTSLTSETLSDYLTSAVTNPSTLFASGLNGVNDPKTDAKEGIGSVSASVAIFGVFVAGGTQPEELLVTPNLSANVKSYKAPAATGDAFVHEAAKKQPAGIVVHTAP